jgi:hypothetical protein
MAIKIKQSARYAQKQTTSNASNAALHPILITFKNKRAKSAESEYQNPYFCKQLKGCILQALPLH